MEEPKEGELCGGFPCGAESMVTSTGVSQGTRHCMKKKEKENGNWAIESPYIHNSFFPPRD
jgi:hypothetical protein